MRTDVDAPLGRGVAASAFDDDGSGAGRAPLATVNEMTVAMAREIEVGAAAELVPAVVRGAGRYAVGNADGELFAVTRRCRHLGADLANGSVDGEGCLVCPWLGAGYDVATGRRRGARRASSRRSPAWMLAIVC
jgi:nitrite reductase/ring-hydroxylating ferredoxin subunit